MQAKKTLGLTSLISLQTFSIFPEYFITISLFYFLIVTLLTTYKIHGLMIQKAISECIALVLLMACYLTLNDDLIVAGILSFNQSIKNDCLALYSGLCVCFFSALYFFIISDSLKEQKLTSCEYLLIVLFAVVGLMLLCKSNDFLIAYLTIELSSLAFYVLASFRKTSNYSIESGLIYFINGAISSAFFLFGSSLIYGFTGSINFSDFAYLFDQSLLTAARPCVLYKLLDIRSMYAVMNCILYQIMRKSFYTFETIDLGLTLILFSLFIKLALAPFHLWLLDVYEGSPTNSTIFFSVITKLSIFVLLIRLYFQHFFFISTSWQFYSLWVGVFSITLGSFGGLKQRKFKTLLAYSSITHMGYLLIAFSLESCLGLIMLLFYLVIYMISSLSIWSIFLLLRLKQDNEKKYNKELSDFVLLMKSNPALAFILSLAMFSIAGIPPMVGFFAKINIFLSVVGHSFYKIALISLLFSTISTFYYIRIIKILYFENFLVGKLYYPIETKKALLLSVLVFLFLFLFINPTFLYVIIDKILTSIIQEGDNGEGAFKALEIDM